MYFLICCKSVQNLVFWCMTSLPKFQSWPPGWVTLPRCLGMLLLSLSVSIQPNYYSTTVLHPSRMALSALLLNFFRNARIICGHLASGGWGEERGGRAFLEPWRAGEDLFGGRESSTQMGVWKKLWRQTEGVYTTLLSLTFSKIFQPNENQKYCIVGRVPKI